MTLFDKIRNGDQSAISKGITLIESSLPSDLDKADNLLYKCLPISGNSIRIGITGIPGVGKSTFIESFGKLLTSQGKKVAVLAIDPTSERTQGSILGDKSRMSQLAIDKNAFIRPSPNSGNLGGVGKKTRDSIILCEAAGYDVILVETMGVGQSEISVNHIVDFFLLLMISGAGDELQGIKRGIMEEADAILINKADGENIDNAKISCLKYKSSLDLLPPKENSWRVKTGICSGLNKTGLNKILEIIKEYKRQMNSNGYFNQKREMQNKYWLNQEIKYQFGDKKLQELKGQHKLSILEKEIKKGKKTIYQVLKNL